MGRVSRAWKVRETRTPAKIFVGSLSIAMLVSGQQAGGPPAEAKPDAKPAAVCRLVDLSKGKSSTKASDVADKFAGLGQEITVKDLDEQAIFACAPAASIDQLVAAVNKVAGVEPPAAAADRPESHDARLFFYRQASKLAPILDKVYPTISVSAIGEDVLIFKTTDRADENKIHELKRWITVLDTPRPELTVNAWSVQVSSSDATAISDISERVRERVGDYNLQLKRSLDRAWMYLNSIRRDIDKYAAPYFSNYILDTYQGETEVTEAKNIPHICGGVNQYCLGYMPSFTATMPPTLSNLIGVLAAAKDPSRIGARFADCLEGKLSCVKDNDAVPALTYVISSAQNSPSPTLTCDVRDRDEHGKVPRFNCFRDELQNTLSNPARVAMLRTAMADFLFQYKFSSEFPHQFDPYDYARSSQVLDAQLDPLLTAFNRDVIVYLKLLEEGLQCDKPRGLSFASNGIVTLRLISGSDPSEVNGTTQSAFPETPAPLLDDFVKNLSSEEGKMPNLLSTNLGAHGAAALTAFLNSGHGTTVSIGRNLDLKITPTSLPGASSAELAVHFESKDSDKPQDVKGDGTTVVDNTTDRVASHIIDTKIRLESLGLFEISTLSSELSRGRKPIPLVPPFVDLPYIGSLVQLPRKPAQVQHRSFVILSAALMPTAADLVSGMRFEHDKSMRKDPGKNSDKPISVTLLPDTRQDELAVQFRDRHKRFLPCIAFEAMDGITKHSECVLPGEAPTTVVAIKQ